jgi:hypothetical protein
MMIEGRTIKDTFRGFSNLFAPRFLPGALDSIAHTEEWFDKKVGKKGNRAVIVTMLIWRLAESRLFGAVGPVFKNRGGRLCSFRQ